MEFKFDFSLFLFVWWHEARECAHNKKKEVLQIETKKFLFSLCALGVRYGLFLIVGRVFGIEINFSI